MKSKGKSKFLQNHRGEGDVSAENLDLFFQSQCLLTQVLAEGVAWSGGEKSSQQRCSMKKGILRNFAKFTGKHLYQSLLFNKVAGLSPWI